MANDRKRLIDRLKAMGHGTANFVRNLVDSGVETDLDKELAAMDEATVETRESFASRTEVKKRGSHSINTSSKRTTGTRGTNYNRDYDGEEPVVENERY